VNITEQELYELRIRAAQSLAFAGEARRKASETLTILDELSRRHNETEECSNKSKTGPDIA